MSIDKIVLDKVKEKLKENNQSEEAESILDLLKKRDVQDLIVGEKNEFIEGILKKQKYEIESIGWKCETAMSRF